MCVWTGISLGGGINLCVLSRGNLTAQQYRDDILHPYVRSYAGAVGKTLLLQDDNARSHSARLLEQYLEEETIVRMEWPAG